MLIKQFKFLEELFENCEFEGNINCDNCWEKIISHIPCYALEEWQCGVSKCCIFLNGFYDFVIKIPFNTTEELEDITCAYYGEREWDYIEDELYIYDEAIENKCEKFFLKNMLIGCINNYPIYIQERGKSYERYEGDMFPITDVFYKEAEDLMCQTHSTVEEVDWVAYCIALYSKRKTRKLLNFLSKNEYDDDLHCGNVGFDINGKPCIIDYSGWRD